MVLCGSRKCTLTLRGWLHFGGWWTNFSWKWQDATWSELSKMQLWSEPKWSHRASTAWERNELIETSEIDAKRTPTHRKSCMGRFWHTFLPLFSRDVAIYPDFSFFSIIFIRCCNLSKIPFIFSPQGRIDVFYGNSTAFCSWARLWSSLPEPTRLSAHFVLLANPLSRRSHPVEVESLAFNCEIFRGEIWCLWLPKSPC